MELISGLPINHDSINSITVFAYGTKVGFDYNGQFIVVESDSYITNMTCEHRANLHKLIYKISISTNHAHLYYHDHSVSKLAILSGYSDFRENIASVISDVCQENSGVMLNPLFKMIEQSGLTEESAFRLIAGNDFARKHNYDDFVISAHFLYIRRIARASRGETTPYPIEISANYFETIADALINTIKWTDGNKHIPCEELIKLIGYVDLRQYAKSETIIGRLMLIISEYFHEQERDELMAKINSAL